MAVNNAQAILNDLLGRYGLSNLANWAWQTYTQAGGGDLGMQTVQAELPKRAEYVARFPALAERDRLGLMPITPADYLNYENGLRQAFVQYGMQVPLTGAGFNDIVTKLLTADKSLAEVVDQDIGQAYAKVAAAPQEVRDAAARAWGLNSQAALASYFLDPELSSTELARQGQGMQVAGGVARLAGIDLSRERALRLADLGADQGLGNLDNVVKLRPLYSENAGEGTDLSLEDQGLSAAFGENATAQEQIRRRLQAREAAFGGSGGAATASGRTGGIVGLGEGEPT